MSPLSPNTPAGARSSEHAKQEVAAASLDQATRPSTVAAAGKGGTGKSTLLISLAACLARSATVVLVDLDIDNASTLRWSLLRRGVRGVPPITVIKPEGGEAPVATLERALDLADAVDGQSIVLVDLPGRPRRDLPTDLWQRLDLVYVPLEASLMVAGATKRLLEGYRQDGANGPCIRPIVNRWPTERRMADAVTALGDGIVAPVSIKAYVAHADAYAAGLGVTELNPQHKSADDIRRLAADMRGVLRGISESQQTDRWTLLRAASGGTHNE